MPVIKRHNLKVAVSQMINEAFEFARHNQNLLNVAVFIRNASFWHLQSPVEQLPVPYVVCLHARSVG